MWGKLYNNESHAKTLLKIKLEKLGGSDFSDLIEDIPTLINLIEVYLPEISDNLTENFWNDLLLFKKVNRIGRALKPLSLKTDKGILTKMAEAIVGMHNDKISYVFTKTGITFLNKNKRVICSSRRWMLTEGSLKDYSAEVIFNQIKKIDDLVNYIPADYINEKNCINLKNENNNVCVKYITITELIEIFTSNKLVEL